MDGAVEKTITFILFIVIGVILKKKFTSKDEVNGIKKIILSLALPATIFIALLKIKIDSNFAVLPVMAIGLNVLLFIITPLLLLFLGITKKSTIATSKLLIPSLAPGLSCFPFILEFLGEDYLAKAAMADLGNKFFVLFILYLVAIKWHYKNLSLEKEPIGSKLKSLGKTMISEPVNLFIFVALVLVSFGITFVELPFFMQDTLGRLSFIMTPLVLIFIGLAVKIQKKQFAQIFSLLMLRASITLFVICIFVSIFDMHSGDEILFMIAFSLSACSFWPFAHISSIASKERDIEEHKKTFDVNFALSILALSLPVSVMLILGILTTGNTFSSIDNILLLATLLLFLGILYPLTNWFKQGARVKNVFRQVKEA